MVGLILDGMPRKKIAIQLNISMNTLLGHIEHIYRKMGVKSESGMLFKALLERMHGKKEEEIL